MDKKYSDLNDEDKKKYNEIAETMFGKSNVFVETGEPMYFDEKMQRLPTETPIMDALQMLKNTN